MEENDQIQVVKKEAMRVADEVLSHPTLYQIATETLSTALQVLPHFAVYNRLNAWGKHRDIPEAATETFHEWYRTHRLNRSEVSSS
jgi:L-lactate dehydrogenase complex protein LldF